MRKNFCWFDGDKYRTTYRSAIFRGRGFGRGGPMNSMPRGFGGPPMRRGMMRGMMPRGMGFR